MTRLVQEGKVRYLGVSNFSVAQLKRLQSIHPVASNQPPYSMLRRDIEAELLPYCAANKIGVVVYSPIESGCWLESLIKITSTLCQPMIGAVQNHPFSRNRSSASMWSLWINCGRLLKEKAATCRNWLLPGFAQI
jgi:diketogulonate reductase-like aldo/keto reductase